MADVLDISTKIDIDGPTELLGLPFYSFSIDFAVIDFPDNPESALEVLQDLASNLEESGFTTQAVNLRAEVGRVFG